jgi:cyclopropane fatty-acyl-phospholipid synthase-like methyltransferase
MRIYDEPIPEVTRYLKNNGHKTIDDMRPAYDSTLRLLRQYLPLNQDTRILEIGTGTGWFPVMAQMDGLSVKGLEISPQLVENAKTWGRSLGIEPNVELGNAEETDIGDSRYDAVIANSVFEHIEKWELALSRVYKALKPGGVFWFASSNRWCPYSHEYPTLFYSYLPDQMRYQYRIKKAGPEIMKLGIDFNQFTYPQLRKAFKEVGFREVHDRVQMMPENRFGGLKGLAIKMARRSDLVKWPILTFCDATSFVCRK